MVLLLRDIEQLSTEEAAAALGLGIPALKARLFRATPDVTRVRRPHFATSAKRMDFVITCDEFMAEFGDYLEGEVAAEVRRQIESHLSPLPNVSGDLRFHS